MPDPMRVRRALATVVAATLTAGLAAGTPAHAAPTVSPSATSSGAVSVPAVIGWGPASFDKDHDAYVVELVRLIDAAPAGAVVRGDWYLYNDTSLTAALKRAFHRGVHVQLVVDGSRIWAQRSYLGRPDMAGQLADLRRTFGSDVHAKSFVLATAGSPFDGATAGGGFQHAKFFTVSSVGSGSHRRRWVSSWASNNPTYSNTVAAWGEARFVVGNEKLYLGLAAFHKQMLVEKRRNAYRVIKAGTTTLHLYPSFYARHDVLADRLNAIHSCAHVSIRVAMFSWTASRVNVAQRLRTLAAKGCAVEVITNYSGPTSTLVAPSVWSALFKPGPGRILVRSGNNPVGTLHLKTAVIRYAHSQVAITGSRNLTGGTTTAELTGEDTSASVVASYEALLAQVRSHSRVIPAAPKLVSPSSAAARRDAEDEALDD